MNGFRFYKSKPNPTISFRNPNLINWQFQIEILFKSKILSIVFCQWQNNPSTVFASWGKLDISNKHLENKLKLTYALFLAQNTIIVDSLKTSRWALLASDAMRSLVIKSSVRYQIKKQITGYSSLYSTSRVTNFLFRHSGTP